MTDTIVELIMTALKPPKTLKIGYKDYKVQEVSSFSSSQQLGQCNNQEWNLQYRDAGIDVENMNTILHEAMHGCFYVYGLCEVYENRDEERIVNTLTNALVALLKDNPKLVTYITEALDG